MNILIVEDDFASRKLLQNILSKYGQCDLAINGVEAVEAFKMALDNGNRYDLICIDIKMPKMNGREALVKIREIEDERKILTLDKTKVIMTTALGDAKNIIGSFTDQCEAYIVKPIKKEDLEDNLKEFDLIS